jgi:hypothetical protein
MDMMLLEFKSLSQDDQVVILYCQGVYIGKKKNKWCTSLLYQLETFYVEVSYTSYRRFIHQIVVTDSITILDPYLEQIQLEYFVA